MRAKVAERGQVTIPKALRERLGIRPGTVLDFSDDSGRLIAVKADTEDPVDRLFGKYSKGRSTDAIMNDLRATP